MGVNHRSGHIAMAKKLLDLSDKALYRNFFTKSVCPYLLSRPSYVAQKHRYQRTNCFE